MGRPVSILLLFAVAGSCSREEPAAPPRPAPAPPGPWIELFDGRTLTGWKTTDGQESWGVEDGGILALKMPGGGHLHSLRTFKDFELLLEFRLDGGTDTGVFFRWADPADPAQTALEIQVADGGPPGPLDPETCGALQSLKAPVMNAVKPAGEWSTLRLVCQGPRVQAWINGQDALDADLSHWTEAGKNPGGSANRYRVPAAKLPPAGHIGFENGRYTAWFCNVRLRELPSR